MLITVQEQVAHQNGFPYIGKDIIDCTLKDNILTSIMIGTKLRFIDNVEHETPITSLFYNGVEYPISFIILPYKIYLVEITTTMTLLEVEGQSTNTIFNNYIITYRNILSAEKSSNNYIGYQLENTPIILIGIGDNDEEKELNIQNQLDELNSKEIVRDVVYDPLTFTITCNIGFPANDFPEDLRLAIKNLAMHFYASKGGFVMNQDDAKTTRGMEVVARNIFDRYRRRGV